MDLGIQPLAWKLAELQAIKKTLLDENNPLEVLKGFVQMKKNIKIVLTLASVRKQNIDNKTNFLSLHLQTRANLDYYEIIFLK
jgi:hypothetical protein